MLTGVSAEAVERAADALRPYLRHTPLQLSRAFQSECPAEIHLKLESAQPIRAFKVRGALNKVLRMTAEERSGGLITASAGNHGLGVAYAAMTFGMPATVYVPRQANRLKVEAIQRLGATVVARGSTYQEAFQEAERDRGERTLVHAYDDADVIAGQGTVAVELLAELDSFDTVVVPIGGGGLISGIATYLKARRPAVRVIGIEPVGAAAMKRSLEAGRPVSLERIDTIADGLAASRPGVLTFDIVRRFVDEVHLVEDDEMVHAIGLLFEREHLLAEPAGAAGLAGLLHRVRSVAGERVVVVVSGANVTDDVMLRALKSR